MRLNRLTSNTITRPNDVTAYASGDLVANNTTAGSVTPFTFYTSTTKAGGMKIWRARLDKSGAVATNATFRLHLYESAPTVTNGDNGAWLSTSSGYIGSIDIDASTKTFSAGSSGSGVYTSNSVFAPLLVVASQTGVFYGLLEARAAYTPVANETFTVALVGEEYM